MEDELKWLLEAKRIKLELDRGKKSALKEEKQNEEDEKQHEEDEGYCLKEQAQKEEDEGYRLKEQKQNEEDDWHRKVVNPWMNKLYALRHRHFEEMLQLAKEQHDELISFVVKQTIECHALKYSANP